MLMYLLSKGNKYKRAPTRDTRSAAKINFKVPNKISYVYEHSPYYIGTKLWNGISENVQKIDNVFGFKKEIAKMYESYAKLQYI